MKIKDITYSSEYVSELERKLELVKEVTLGIDKISSIDLVEVD